MFYALRGGSFDVVVRGEQGLALWWTLLLGLAFGLLPRSGRGVRLWLVLGACAALALWMGRADLDGKRRAHVRGARARITYAGLLVGHRVLRRRRSAPPSRG